MTLRECDAPEGEHSTYYVTDGAVLWNAHGEWACGAHQRWLARPREAAAVAA